MSSTKWVCPRCTLENEIEDPTCKMCQVERPSLSTSKQQQQEEETPSTFMMTEQEVSPHGTTTQHHQINQNDNNDNNDNDYSKANKELLNAIKSTGEDGATTNAKLQAEEKLKAEERKKKKEDDAKASNDRFKEEHEKLLAAVHGTNANVIPKKDGIDIIDQTSIHHENNNDNNGFSPKESEGNNANPSPSANDKPTTNTTGTGATGPYQGVPSYPSTNNTNNNTNNNNNFSPSYPIVAGTVLGGGAGALGGLAFGNSNNNNNNSNNTNNNNSITSPQAGPNEWICSQCTLINKAANARCEVCGAKNPLGDANGPWIKYEMTQIEYDHLVACYFRFLGNAPDDRMGRAEITKLCRFLNFAHTEEQITNLFREMDKDRSGTLSCDEFVSWCAGHRPDPQSLYNLTQPEYHGVLFSVDKYDRNHDGYLTPSECISLLMDKGFCKTLDEAHVMTTLIDADHDGKITLHEILVAHAEMKKNGRLTDRVTQH